MDLKTKHYCEFYQHLINSCLETNKEVFGKECPQFCTNFTVPYNEMCKK